MCQLHEILIDSTASSNQDAYANRQQLIYYPNLLDEHFADEVFATLINQSQFNHHRISLFGRTVLEPRLTNWYGEPHCLYTYSGRQRRPDPFPPCLQQLRQKLIEQLTACDILQSMVAEAAINCALVNLYRDGADGVGWHRDNEQTLSGHIFSLSLGATRNFDLKHQKTGEKHRIPLHHRDCVVMTKGLQKNWLHCVAKSKRVTSPRINITFRQYISNPLP